MSAHDLLSASGALLLVILLVFLLRHGARFLHPRGAGGGARLMAVAQLGLDSKRRLQLVQCDGHQLVVLTGGASDMMMVWPPVTPLVAVAERG